MYGLYVGKSNHKNYWPLNGSTTGLTITGTTRWHAGLIGGMNKALRLLSATAVIPFGFVDSGRGSRGYTMEFSVIAYDDFTFGPLLQYDAAAGELTALVHFADGSANVVAKMEVASLNHVVMTYGNGAISLFLNGVEFSAPVEETLYNSGFQDLGTALDLAGDIAIQGIATYDRRLTGEQISDHFLSTKMITPSETIATVYDGTDLTPVPDSMLTLAEFDYVPASNGSLSNMTVVGGIAMPNLDSSNTYLNGTWEVEIDIPDEQTIEGIAVEYVSSGPGTVSLYAKIGTGSWVGVSGGNIPGVYPSLSTDEQVMIQLRTTGNVSLSSIHVNTFSQMKTSTARALEMEEASIVELGANRFTPSSTALMLGTNLLIDGAEDELNAVNIVGMFFDTPVSAELSGQMYVNGAAASTVPEEEWCVVTLTGTATTDPIDIDLGASAYIRNLSVYNLPSVAANVLDIYGMICGVTVNTVSMGSAVFENNVDVDYVAAEWVITKSE